MRVRDQFLQNENVKTQFLLVWAICGSELSSPSARAAGGFYLTCHSTKAWCNPPSRWRIIASSLYSFLFIPCRTWHQPLSCESAGPSVTRQEFESDGSDNKFNLVRQIKRWRLLKGYAWLALWLVHTQAQLALLFLRMQHLSFGEGGVEPSSSLPVAHATKWQWLNAKAAPEHRCPHIFLQQRLPV